MSRANQTASTSSQASVLISKWTFGSILFVIGLLGFFWFQVPSRSTEFALNSPSRSITSLQQAVFRGDTAAYYQLRTAYLDEAQEDFLFWAMLMANKHDYPAAHLDVYDTLMRAYTGGTETTNFTKVDAPTQRLLLHHLTRAADQGVAEAVMILRQVKSHSNQLIESKRWRQSR